MKKIIDCHCHIVPEVDDGAKDLEEAIKMAKIAYKDGIRTIINTSHFYDPTQFVTGNELKRKVEAFKEKLKEEKIEIEILHGNEAYISLELPMYIEEKKVFTLNNSKYLLMELPLQEMPMYINEVLYKIQLKGIVPIIAHPERYVKVIEDPTIVKDLIEQGALIQVNAGSIRGSFGQDIQKTAKTLIKHNMVHLIGSDAHSSRSRRPTLSKAFDLVSEIMDEDYAKKIFYHNPNAIIHNEEIEIPQPIKIEKNKNFSMNIFTKLFRKRN
ncbi:capsular biosynthesis protein [Lutibacter sp. B2]|nr:capsular biosynthesis protein [Lutibacter sp. B2]